MRTPTREESRIGTEQSAGLPPDGGRATHRVKRRLGAGIGVSYPERIWLDEGTLLRRVELFGVDQLDASSHWHWCSIGRYEVLDGDHAGIVVTVTHGATSSPDDRRVIEQHEDLERV